MSDAGPAFPLFYRQPEALNPERHGQLALDPRPSYAFARAAVSIPLSANEMGMASRHYPIVFGTGDEGLPVAVLGLRRDENLFVSEEGHWAEARYVPAYARRYPFILAAQSEPDRFSLCIDRASGRVGENGGDPLFDEAGKPTGLVDSALEFCSAFERGIARTREVVRLLKRHELLVPNEAAVTLPSGSRLELRDFLVVDPERFERLSDEAFIELRRGGALGPVYAHLISRSAWEDLLRLEGATGA